MKKILGLDLGTTSIGWAMVNERENDDEQSSIVKLGVRVNPLTVDEISNFERGKSITTNADRTLKRSMRRNLQRYKLRRDNLIEVLTENNIIDTETVLTETGAYSTFDTYRKRALAATSKIELTDFARVLMQINKKRGYKSSRKLKTEDDGVAIDGMSVAKTLYDNKLTPAQYSLSILKAGKKQLPDYYRSDLLDEFNKIWQAQKEFYPEILTDEFKTMINGRGKLNTSKIFLGRYKIYTAENKGKESGKQALEWRIMGISQQLPQDICAYVISDLNGSISNSSGYLGAISDRSKELYFKQQTVGQYLMEQLESDPNYSLRNQVFYRQDYLDEFERIWEELAKHYPQLSPVLKSEIRDIIIFYQRPLKSQKGLISFCEFESKRVEIRKGDKVKKITIGAKVAPRSSPLFQEFKIWQILNNVKVTGPVIIDELLSTQQSFQPKYGSRFLEQEEKEILFKELNFKESLSKQEALKLLYSNHKELDLNFKEKIEGNRTIAALLKAFQKIIINSGNGEPNFAKMHAEEIRSHVTAVFEALGYPTDLLDFDSSSEFEKQNLFKLWHLLYSYEGDDSTSGNDKLIAKLEEMFGFNTEAAKTLSNTAFQDDYGSLSTKAMRKIIPHLKEGYSYDVACTEADYRHSSRSLTKEELDNKKLVARLDILPKNSLRNPVVEKILNQMINVVNQVIDTYGKPDEIRVELARELKKSAKEREDTISAIRTNTSENEKIKAEIAKDFGFSHISRNDIVRYKLYQELKENGYKTLYTNTYIPREKIFSKEFDIEHIIPQSRLFDDSFSNKTLEKRDANIEKGSMTAYDYVLEKYGESGLDSYLANLDILYSKGVLRKAKYDKLKTKGTNIKEGFIERDLRNTQYIAKKAREILESVVKVVVPTTGSITDRLREDWQLIDVMQELNWNKYEALSLTEVIIGRDGQRIRRIKDWTKRNDHRHHAMDALTVAFTKHSHIQYLNNLNARIGRDKLRDGILGAETTRRASSIYAIEDKELSRDKNKKMRFLPPIMPVENFRYEAKKHLEEVLISIKAKNKVTTRNNNRTKSGRKVIEKEQLTPRGQLHNETVYGNIKQYVTKMERVGSSFDEAKISSVASKQYRELLLKRLQEFNNDPKKAFTGKNSLDKSPIYLDEQMTQPMPSAVKTVLFDDIYTIRKEVNPDLNIKKIIDKKVRTILEERLNEYGGDSKKAFSNLDENPIWLNKEKGIKIKRVKINGVSNVVALHSKRDHLGQTILDKEGHRIPTDFVSTGNNHHVAIYRDNKGNLQESIVSFFEATARVNLGFAVVDREYRKDDGWEFLFSMKQNEYFVFPRYKDVVDEDGNSSQVMTFNPMEIDIMDPQNYSLISPNLFRVQKLATKNYTFRHHLDTSVEEHKALRDITWKRIQNTNSLEGAIKVRVNHIGQIVSMEEY